MRRPHGGQHDADGIDFSVNVNPLGPPDQLLEAASRARGEIHRYPYAEYERFRNGAAHYHGLQPEAVLPSAGVGEVLSLLAHHLSEDRVQIGVPSFTEYEDLIGTAARDCERVELPLRWNDPTRVVDRFDPSSADALILCNPSNPAGWSLPGSALGRLLERCREAGALLVVDEAFVECTPNPLEHTAVSHLPKTDRLLVLRSLTKLYAIPGLRVGYALGNPSLIRKLRSIQNPWPLGTGALRAGIRSFRETDFAARSRRFFSDQRRRVEKRCRAISDLELIPSRVNYFLARSEDVELIDELAEVGIYVRDASTFTGLGPGWFRFSLKKSKRTDQLLSRLHDRLATSRPGAIS